SAHGGRRRVSACAEWQARVAAPATKPARMRESVRRAGAAWGFGANASLRAGRGAPRDPRPGPAGRGEMLRPRGWRRAYRKQGAGSRGLGARFRRIGREPDHEARASPASSLGGPGQPVADLDPGVVLGDDLAHDRQAEPAAFGLAVQYTVEALEDELAVGRRDAAAVVLHIHFDLAFQPADAHVHDAAFGRVAQRIVDQ